MRVFHAVLLLLAGAAQSSDKPVELKLEGLEVVNRAVTVAGGEVYLDAAPGAGFAWIKGLELNEGCLSLEVKGNNDFGRSFVGLAFRGVDKDTYDSVYVRPFVFQSEKPEEVKNGVQYMSLPEFGWPVLRERSPGQYEKSVGSRPNPTDWVQLKIKFGAGRMQAFVDGAATPQLDLPLLTKQTAGRAAFWVGNNSVGGFRNLRRCD
jgi:hypothetical protein